MRGRGGRATRGLSVLASGCMALGVVLGVATAGPCHAAAGPRRVAVLVGNNQGGRAHPALRYAEDDVARVARVLSELGGFADADVHVLTGRPLVAVRAVLADVRRLIATTRAQGNRTVVLFYFSGHSDGDALELGNDLWAFSDLRTALKDLAPDIRIVIVDSCQSGALLAVKGGTPGPAFDIRFTDDLATSGEAVLTSSAAHERALESREIHASFFSHHFVSGLRGAADSSGDGRVTLGEAYRYAFVNTLLATSNTLSGPQHPAYDFRLSGQGELVLTEVVAHGAILSLPRGFDRILIADERRRFLLAELTTSSSNRIALPAGRYAVQARLADASYETVVTLAEGEQRNLGSQDLRPAARATSAIKGGDADLNAMVVPEGQAAASPHLVIGVSGALTGGAADALPLLPGLQLSLATTRTAGFALQLDLASGHATGFRESAAYLGLGAFVARERGRWRGTAGWRVSGGGVVQSLDDHGPTHWTLAAGTGPWLAGSLALTPRLALVLNAALEVRIMRRDLQPVAPWPLLSLGAALRL